MSLQICKMGSKNILTLIVISLFFGYSSSVPAIDNDYLENVLDAEECHQQIRTIRRNVLLGMQFADAGIRFPRGALTGNTVDLGNYHQCLAIEHSTNITHIQGKYCSIRVPMNQTFSLPRPNLQHDWTSLNPAFLQLNEETIDKIKEYELKHKLTKALIGDFSEFEDVRTIPNNPLSGMVFTLGVCVPAPCSTQQAMTSYLFNLTAFGFDYTENFCRLPDDKPWSGADTAAVVVFSAIGFLTVLSTSYDLCYRFVLKKDIKKVNAIYQSCSVYTNGQRLMSFSAGPGALNCVDGIRAISMMWIILGHSFSTEPLLANPFNSWMWLFSANSLWVTVATASVDTFFALSGILIVYTTAGKMNGTTLLKNLHWFYIGRIVRITPLLAIAVLLQASFLNRITDGPTWQNIANYVNNCRNYWWSTLLNIQNWLHPHGMCVSHSWYVAIDIQIYIVSPLVLYWVLGGRRRHAWLALIAAFLAVLAASTIYNFYNNFQAGTIVPSRGGEIMNYMENYYFNTLTRASPFFVGLIFGYILHIYKGHKVNMPWILNIALWTCAGAIAGCIIYFKYRIMQFDWDNQFLDNLMNSVMRPAWAAAVGLVVFACVHGYGGPVNWFLSLSIWRLPARLSYGMYLFHYPIMFMINGTMVVPIYFTVGLFTFKFLSHLTLSILVSFFLTLLVDSPVSALYKQLTISVLKKKVPSTQVNNTIIKDNADDKSVDVKDDKTNVEDVVEINETKDNAPAITIK